jgi:predicted Na+-dependent transporter
MIMMAFSTILSSICQFLLMLLISNLFVFLKPIDHKSVVVLAILGQPPSGVRKDLRVNVFILD